MRLLSPIFVAVAVLVLAVGTVGAQTKPINMTLSGVGGFTLEITEVYGQEVSVGMSICGGTSNLGGGKFTCTTSGWSKIVPAEENTRCPGGREFVYTEGEFSHIIRFDDGEVLAMVPKFEQDFFNNYYCLYFCDPADHDCPMLGFYGVDYKTWEIIGGSGRFQGATGEASWELRGTPVPYVGGDKQWAVHPSPFTGYITLEKE